MPRRYSESSYQNEGLVDVEEADGPFPLPGLLGTPPRKEMNLAGWMDWQMREERKPFQPMWDEVVRRVSAGEFRTRVEAAERMGKRYDWMCSLLQLALKQRVFTEAELAAYLPGRKRLAPRISTPRPPLQSSEPGQSRPQ